MDFSRIKFLLAILVSMGCFSIAACGGGGGGNKGGGGPAPIPGFIFNRSPIVEVFVEIEPNDTMATATPLPLTDTANIADIVIGLGDVDTSSDIYDFYSLTASHGRGHHFQLCASDCAVGASTGNIDVAAAYFDVLDASGNILISTANDPGSGNIVEIELDAGVLYYVVVTAENTPMPFQFYSIFLIDRFEG
jgi:hypothetical protein